MDVWTSPIIKGTSRFHNEPPLILPHLLLGAIEGGDEALVSQQWDSSAFFLWVGGGTQHCLEASGLTWYRKVGICLLLYLFYN